MSGFGGRSRSWRAPFAPGLSFPSLETPYFRDYAGSIDPADQITIAAELGFPAVFDSYLMSRTADEQAAVGERVAQAGLVMAGAIFAPETMRKPLWSVRDAVGIEKLEAAIRESVAAAKRGGTRRLVVLTGRRRFLPVGEQLYDFADNLRRFAPLLEEEGIELCIEPACPELAPHVLVQRLMDGYTVVRMADSPAVSLMFDVYHIAMTEGDLIGTMKWVADRTGAIQLSDSFRQEPGSGAFNLPPVIVTALQGGFSGYFELEHLFSTRGAAGLDLALDRLAAIDDAVLAALGPDDAAGGAKAAAR